MEASYWCGRQARGGTQTALGESAARHTHSLCVQVRGLGSADDERVQTALFPHGIHTSGGYRASLWTSAASYPEYLLSWEDSLEPRGGQEESLPFQQVHSSAPT